MYLNNDEKKIDKANKRLTLTWDVFKSWWCIRTV